MKNTCNIAAALTLAFAISGCGSEPSSSEPEVTGPAVDTTEAGFPCDVHAVLQATCASCHAGRVYYGPNFDSRDDMFRPAAELFLVQTKPVAPGTLGEHVVVALRGGSMPPYGSLATPAPAERELVIAWVESGMPAGPCGGLSSTP